jgi:hypothetical protein
LSLKTVAIFKSPRNPSVSGLLSVGSSIIS